MDTIEKYIYKANKNGIQLNDTYTNNKNPTFDIVYKYQQAVYQRKHSHPTSHQYTIVAFPVSHYAPM
jgi:hypothetical protein